MPANAALRDYLKTRRSVGIGFLKDPGPTPAELDEILTIGTRVPDHGKFVPWRLIASASPVNTERLQTGNRSCRSCSTPPPLPTAPR